MIRFAVAIAAGGSSRRLGREKPLVRLGGKTLLEHAVGYASAISDDVYLLARSADRLPGEFKGKCRPRVIPDSDGDSFPDRLVTSLRRIPAEMVFLMGCDTPFLDPILPAFLSSRIGGHGAAVPVWENGQVEPLAAVYSVPRLPDTGGFSSMRDLCLAMGSALLGVGPFFPRWTFLNINTWEDLLRAESMLRLFRSRRSCCGRSSTPRGPPLRCLW